MSVVRKIIEIDEELCTGCGECIPGCAEGALQIIDGKARLVSDLFCDGLGACIGQCPTSAIRVVEREAEPYDERKVMETIVNTGPATIAAHLRHLEKHGATDYHRQGIAYLKEKGVPVPEDEQAVSAAAQPQESECCPGPSPQQMGQGECRPGSEAAHDSHVQGCSGSRPLHAGHGGGCPSAAPLKLAPSSGAAPSPAASPSSRLGNWPVQIDLAPVNAPYFAGAHLLIAADCTAFATAAFHEELAKDRVVLVGCPKLDDAARHADKLTAILAAAGIRSITVAHMTVPCCFGMVALVKAAVEKSGKQVPLHDVVIGLDGRIEHSGRCASGRPVAAR